jgi:hypothetical protein
MDQFPLTHRSDNVPLEPFQRAFAESGMTVSELARRLDFVHTVPNIDRTRRLLGLRPDTDSRVGKRKRPRSRITYRNAVKLADALGLDYTDVGV